MRSLALLAAPAALVLAAQSGPSPTQIIQAFGRQGIRINGAEAEGIRPNVCLALDEARAHGLGDSKVDFAAVEIASLLGLDSGPGSGTVRNLVSALGELNAGAPAYHPYPPRPRPRPLPLPPPPAPSWNEYFDATVNLWNRPDFLSLVQSQGFSPVKISWEDIGRYQNSSWGDRISDVGIWVRRNEWDPASAQLALSVRRDSNFRDKVLMVPAEKIKVHVRSWGRTVERTLPERLAELGLASQQRDRNVIVSNQFAIVPVPGRGMENGWRREAPRAAFNFSIYPYGSTNFVITDVIEGSSEAVVGPGTHQMLYANVGGGKAPFTASRAEDRPDLLRLEQSLKAQGMDVDVQRYYLIQVPLKPGAPVQLSNMGTPPMAQAWSQPMSSGVMSGVCLVPGVAADAAPAPPPTGAAGGLSAKSAAAESMRENRAPGLDKVAIGHGEREGGYSTGAGWRGQRAEEPIRVTVVYFVTPVGPVSAEDMRRFAAAFQQWDSQAIWGGSFVTKESF